MTLWLRLHSPPPRTGHEELPHPALLLTSHQGLCVLSCRERFRPDSQVLEAVVFVQPQLLIEPLPTPPLPAETWPRPRSFQMTSHLLLDPVVVNGPKL